MQETVFWARFSGLCRYRGEKPNVVGRRAGASSATITKWKNGTIPCGEMLCAVADALDCSIDYLLGRTDEMQSHKPNGDVSRRRAVESLLRVAARLAIPEQMDQDDEIISAG